MLQKKWVIQTELIAGLIAVTVLLSVIMLISVASFDAAALPMVISRSDQVDTFNATLPDRSLIFQVASEPGEIPEEPVDAPGANTPGGPIFFGVGDTRVLFEGPGAAAALAAVYPAPEGSDGLDIYAIDPLTGVGQPAFHVSAQAMADARAQAAATNPFVGVVIGEGMGNKLWIFTTGDCLLETTYPDGKSALFVFVC